MSNVRVLLADRNGAVRDALRSVLANEPDMELAGEAEDCANVLDLADKLAFDVAVLALESLDMPEAACIRKLLASCPNARIVITASHKDSRYVLRMLEAGASAYVLKDRAYEELGRAIRVAQAHRTYVSPRIAGITEK